MRAIWGVMLLLAGLSAHAAPVEDIRSYLGQGIEGTLTGHHDAAGGTIEITLSTGLPLVATYGGASFETVAGWKAAAEKAGAPRKLRITWVAEERVVRATDLTSGAHLELRGFVNLDPLDLGAEACEARAPDFGARLGCRKLQLAGWMAEMQRAFEAVGKASPGLKQTHAGFTGLGQGWDAFVTGEMEAFDDSAHALEYYERRVNLAREYTRLLQSSAEW